MRPVPVSQIDAKEVFYEVVAGNRRIKASKLAGLEQIPVIIKHLTDEQALEISLIENLQRSDVHPMEEAAAFKQLLDNNKYTVHDVAARFGKSETFVRQRIRLNLLSEKGQELFYDNKLTLTQAVMLAQFNEDTQADIIEAGENSYNGLQNRRSIISRVY